MPQYFDTTMSLGHLIGANGASAVWRNTCPTITGQTKMFVRVQLSPGVYKYAVLTGSMLMRLVGWAGELMAEGDNDLMTSFAGNAFSAFSVGPLLACSVIAGVGVP